MRIAWAAGTVCAVLIPLGAFAWQQLDRRPAWVTSVVARAESDDARSALRDERSATTRVLQRAARLRGVTVEVWPERELRVDRTRIGDAANAQAERTVVLRSDAEAPLLAVARSVRGIPDVVPGEPRRATHIGDFTLAFVRRIA